MDKLQVILLLGWIFLLLTWTIPYLTKDDIKQRLISDFSEVLKNDNTEFKFFHPKR